MRHHVKQVTHQTIIRHRKNWRFRILVDRNNGFRIFHAGQMLDRAGNTDANSLASVNHNFTRPPRLIQIDAL